MNTSGIRPVSTNVLVRPKDVEERTAGGLIKPDMATEKDAFARTEGVLVAVSPLAFGWQNWPEDTQPPQVGDRVIFSRYAANEITGADGGKYWLMADESIAGVIE